MGECPLCGESTSKPSTRLIKESCGHSKCRLCLLNEESGCSVCEVNSGDIPCTIESIGNFDYRLPATTIPNYEQLHSTPRKLDFNKIPDDCTDCPLVAAKVSPDSSVSNVPGPEMVDMATETDNIVADRDVQSQTTPENTHPSLSQVTPTAPTAQPEVFRNPVVNNQPPPAEAAVVQNQNFMPVSNAVVTQRPDGRQFITIAFIANNSPNKSQQQQHVVAPMLNQCLPALTALQRPPAGNQCIPMIGNLSALQSGNHQFIIRSPNMVQNLVGNQSMPIMGNLSAMPNLTPIVGNVNAAKNHLASNQPLPTISTANAAPQTPVKGQSFSTTGSSNVAPKVVANHAYQAVPKPAESQSAAAPVEEDVSTGRKQVRTRGLPRIKTVKNVNIVQKSAINQSDKAHSQVDKNTPVQAIKGKRGQRRKELPVYLIPRKPNEQAKSPPQKSPTLNSPTMNSPTLKSPTLKSPTLKSAPPSPLKNPAQIIGCMSPEYNLEDYLLFNRQQKASDAATKNSVIQTEAVNDTPIINNPSESVINETPIVSDQFNSLVMDESLLKNNEDELKRQEQVLIDKINDAESTKDVSTETDEYQGQQDLNVVFNITEENKQTPNDEKIEEGKEKPKDFNGDTSGNKEEYQNLDALFDIIEKESKKLNGGMFDKEVNLAEGNDFKFDENQKLHDNVENGVDENHTFNQKDNIAEVKDQNLNNDICDENGDSQDLHMDMGLENHETENLNKEICTDEGVSRGSHGISSDQEQNLVEKLPVQNGAMQHVDECAYSEQENNHILHAGIEYEKEEGEILNEQKECQNLNQETVANITDSTIMNGEIDNKKQVQTENEKLVGVEKENETVNEELSLQNDENQHFDSIEKESENVDEELSLQNDENQHFDGVEKESVDEELSIQNEENQYFDGEIIGKEGDSHDENELNDERDESPLVNEKIDEEDESNEAHYEDVGDEENSEKLSHESDVGDEENSEKLSHESNVVDYENSEKLSHENQELQTPSEEYNDEGIQHHHLDEETVEEENQILDENVDNQDDETNHSLVMDTHPEDDAGLPVHANEDLPVPEANETDNSQLDLTSQTEQSDVVKKRRGRPKKATVVGKDEQILSEKVGGDLSEKLNEMTITGVTESAEPIYSKPRRGRKKKSFSDYELDMKLTRPEKNHQKQATTPAGKKPRGRPKKSLSNAEQSDKLNCSQEPEQPAPKELPVEENNHEEGQSQESDERLDVADESHVLNVSVEVHNPEEGEADKDVQNADANSSLLPTEKAVAENLVNEPAIAVKRPRGRPKIKNISFDVGQSNKIVTDQSTVKKPRGRPKRSLSTTEQPIVQVAEASIATEVANSSSQDQRFEASSRENQVQVSEVFSQEEKSKKPSVDVDYEKIESVPSDADTSAEKNVQEPPVVNENDQSIVVKKRGRPKNPPKRPRGRPRKSLSNFELDTSQETEELSSQDEASQDCMYMSEEENEALYSDFVTSSTFSNVLPNENEQSMVIKKRGRPKKSLSTDEQQSAQPVVVKKARGRPKKSLPSFELDASRETELSNHKVIANVEESKDHHKINQDQDPAIQQPGIVNENEQVAVIKKRGRPKKSLSSVELTASQQTELSDTTQTANHSVITNAEESKDLHEVNEDQDAAVQQPGTENGNEQSIVIKKRGRPKKSLPSFELDASQMTELPTTAEITDHEVTANEESKDQCEVNDDGGQDQDPAIQQPGIVDENEQSAVIKKRGRPKKSLSNFELVPPQEAELSDAAEISNHIVIANVEQSSEMDEDQDPAIQQPGIVDENEQSAVIKKRGRPRKSLSSFEVTASQQTELSDATETANHRVITNVEESKDQREINDDQNLALQQPGTENGNEQSIVIKKRGRPKKSLSTDEQQSQSEVPFPNEQPVIVKKPRGRPPRKPVSNFDQQDDLNISQETELSSIHSEESKYQQEVNGGEENEAQHSEVISQDSNVNEALPSDVVASSTSADEDDPAVQESPTVNGNEQSVEKPSGASEESLNNCEQQSELEVPNVDTEATVVKKSRGRPKKSLSNLEEPTVPAISDSVESNNDQAQCLNGALDTTVDSCVEKIDNSSVSLHNEVDESSVVETESDTTCLSEQITVVKKARGRPKREHQQSPTKVESVVVKKPRGRPKKLNHEEPNESHLSRESEHQTAPQLPTFSTDTTDKHQSSDEHEEHRILDSEGASPGEDNSSLQDDEREADNNDKQETESDLTSKENTQVTSTLSKDDEGENYTSQVEPVEEERGSSQNSKSQDDENKENKEDDAKAENVTPATQEQQDSEKPNEADDGGGGGVAKNNNATGRKYKSFDRINTQVIVENCKRKRKPKVLLYENEDLDISPMRKKKKKDNDKLSCKHEGKATEKPRVDDEQPAKIITVNSVNVSRENDDQKEPSLPNADESSMESTPRDEDAKSAKRNRRPKTLLYENEDLAVGRKSLKKKKVEFLLPPSEDSMEDSNDELPSKRIVKAKSPLYVSDGSPFKLEIKKEDLEMMRKFAIKLEPVIVLDRNIDLSLVKDGSLHLTHASLINKKARGRPKLQSPPKKVTDEKPSRGRSSSSSHIVTLPGDPPTYRCTGCELTFKAYAYRALHAGCAPRRRSFKCEYCPKKFKQGSHLQYHERVHKGERPYGCELCGRRFVQKGKLNRHLLVHKYSQDLECNECGRKFSSKENLKSHLLSHVESSFVYRCNQCPKAFTLDSNRRRHELSHSPVALLKCQHCAKSFKTKYEVTKHAKIHQKVRPFACHDCAKTFVTKFELKRHHVTHSGDKKYTCTHCKQQFGRLDNYSRHMLHHHTLDEPLEAATSSDDDDDDDGGGERQQEAKKAPKKPKKISRTSSNPSAPLAISFVQPLTPQAAPSPYSQSHDLASVIRETLPDLNNAVPVISSPAQASSSLMDPIPLEQAFVLNRQIEEKIYTQSSFCEFPGLTRRASGGGGANRLPSFTLSRRNSSGSNSNSNDGTSFLTANRERAAAEQQDDDEDGASSPRKDIHVHWRRRTAETLKSKIVDQNK